jgi:hypothetical protein
VFDVSSGKLFGYMVSSQGIDANPMKVEAIKQLHPPQTQKKNPKAGKHDGSTQPIHIQVVRT